VRVAAIQGPTAGDGDALPNLRVVVLLLFAIVFPLLAVVAYLSTRGVLSYSSMLEIAADQGGPSTLRVQTLDNSSLQQLSGQPFSYLNPQTLANYSVFGLPAVGSVELLLAVAAAVVVLLVWRSFRVRLGRTSPFEDDGLSAESRRERVVDVLDAAVARLNTGSSYRETVIRCYKTVSEVLADRSDLDGRVLTAREFEARVAEKLDVEPAYLAKMTGLFEVARYSDREITQQQSRDAVACLSEMSSSLKAPPLRTGGAR
jgi:hypothetical protein